MGIESQQQINKQCSVETNTCEFWSSQLRASCDFWAICACLCFSCSIGMDQRSSARQYCCRAPQSCITVPWTVKSGIRTCGRLRKTLGFFVTSQTVQRPKTSDIMLEILFNTKSLHDVLFIFFNLAMLPSSQSKELLNFFNNHEKSIRVRHGSCHCVCVCANLTVKQVWRSTGMEIKAQRNRMRPKSF